MTESTVPAEAGSRTHRLAVVSAGVSDPSTTRMLADRAAQKTLDLLREAGVEANVSVIDLAPLASDVARALVTGFPGESVQTAIDQVAAADALIIATPVYKAGISGLLKSFIDVLDNDLVIATPALLAATAGSDRHAMVVDDHLRPLFAFLRALPVPTALFAAPDDWSSPALTARIARAAHELAQLVRTGTRESIAESAWDGYQHRFAGNATRAQQTVADVNFDTDLMRLATGGQ